MTRLLLALLLAASLFALLLAVSLFAQLPGNISNVSNFVDMVESIQQTGKYLGHTGQVFIITGRRAGFTSPSVLNDVKEFGNAVASIPTITTGDALEVISSSTDDDGSPAGTGVQTVKVTYIDASNNIVESANIVLNGTAAVAAGFTANEILWMETTAVGTGGVAAGNIRLRVVAGAVEAEQISLGGNKSLSARFMVPAGYTAYLTTWDGLAVNNDQDLRLRATVTSLTRTLTSGIYHFQAGAYIPSNAAHFTILPSLRLPALCKVKVSTFSGGTPGTVRAETNFSIVILQN